MDSILGKMTRRKKKRKRKKTIRAVVTSNMSMSPKKKKKKGEIKPHTVFSNSLHRQGKENKLDLN